nr:hypothetical protein [uncultured Roseateles sp.]
MRLGHLGVGPAPRPARPVRAAQEVWYAPVLVLVLVLAVSSAAALMDKRLQPAEPWAVPVGLAPAAVDVPVQVPVLAGPAQAVIETDGERWTLAAPGLPREAAALQLALLSRTELHDPQRLLAAAGRRPVHWSAASLSQAWQALLGSDLISASYCSGAGHCHVWVFGAAAAALPRAASAPASFDFLQVDPPGLFPAEGS